jgi:hypothetical protein
MIIGLIFSPAPHMQSDRGYGKISHRLKVLSETAIRLGKAQVSQTFRGDNSCVWQPATRLIRAHYRCINACAGLLSEYLGYDAMWVKKTANRCEALRA